MDEKHELHALLVGCLMTYRLTALMVFERGAFDLFAKLRTAVGIYFDQFSQAKASNPVAEMFQCPKCLSVWVGWSVALLLYGARRPRLIFLRGLAFSAASIMIQSWVRHLEGHR